MFYNCSSLSTIPQLDTSNVYDMSCMFYNCSSLSTIPQLDTSNVYDMTDMFSGCSSLTVCYLKNIKVDLDLSGSPILTVDSLLFLIKELINVDDTRVFTIGTTNLEKLENIYVKTITITDEMIADDPNIESKIPFEVCESTDDGAMLITDYVTTKNWTIQ